MPNLNETPELGGEADILPPLSPSVSVAANDTLKLPVFWPNTAEVWFAQADTQFAIRSITVSRQSSTSSEPLQLATLTKFWRIVFYALFSEQLSEIWSFCISSVNWRPETTSSHEQDAHAPSGRLQTQLFNISFILCGLFLHPLPIQVRSHLLQEKISDPPTLALKADELFQSRISSSVNLLAGQLEDVQVNAVATRTRPSPSSKRSPTPALSSRSPSSPGSCWYHKKHGDKAQNCWKPCL